MGNNDDLTPYDYATHLIAGRVGKLYIDKPPAGERFVFVRVYVLPAWALAYSDSQLGSPGALSEAVLVYQGFRDTYAVMNPTGKWLHDGPWVLDVAAMVRHAKAKIKLDNDQIRAGQKKVLDTY